MSYYYNDELVYYRQKKSGNVLIVGGLVCLWYISAVITITTSKEIMNIMSFPFFLCTTQFIFASVVSIAYLKISGKFTTIHSSISSLVFQISIGYTFGFILTNTAFSIVSAGFAETVKSAEPISTILIGLCFFQETTTLRTYLTLVPICVGVGLSCYHNEQFNMVGFLLAAGSNVCFSGRAVLAKKLGVAHPDLIDETNLFARISLHGLLFLLPATLLFEGRGLVHLLYDRGVASGGSALHKDVSSGTFTVAHVTTLLLVNGCMFACYNLTSYVVLKHLDLVTHSVLNAFRRVFIIVFTSLYFSIHLSPFNLFGIATAVVGVLLFGYFRSADKPKSLL